MKYYGFSPDDLPRDPGVREGMQKYYDVIP